MINDNLVSINSKNNKSVDDTNDDEVIDIDFNTMNKSESFHKVENNNNNNTNNTSIWNNGLYGIRNNNKSKDKYNNNTKESDYDRLGTDNNKVQKTDIFSLSNEDSDNLYSGRYND